jgi:hypothetical protein
VIGALAEVVRQMLLEFYHPHFCLKLCPPAPPPPVLMCVWLCGEGGHSAYTLPR